MAIKLDKKKLMYYIDEENINTFELYVSPFINLLNSISNSTRPKRVGQLSVLFNEFLDDWNNKNDGTPKLNDWKKYYNSLTNVLKDFEKANEKTGKVAREDAAKNIYDLFKKFEKNLFPIMTIDFIQKWVDDLIFEKTFNGLMLERPIAGFVVAHLLKYDIDSKKKMKFNTDKLHKSNPEQEANGIDFIYIDGNFKILLQIKTGNKQEGDNVRNRQKNTSAIANDVYCCFLDTTIKDNMLLTVLFNKKQII